MFDKTVLAGVVASQLRVLSSNELLATLLTTGALPIEEGSKECERYGGARRTEHDVDGKKIAVTTYVQVTVQEVVEEPESAPDAGPESSGG